MSQGFLRNKIKEFKNNIKKENFVDHKTTQNEIGNLSKKKKTNENLNLVKHKNPESECLDIDFNEKSKMIVKMINDHINVAKIEILKQTSDILKNFENNGKSKENFNLSKKKEQNNQYEKKKVQKKPENSLENLPVEKLLEALMSRRFK